MGIFKAMGTAVFGVASGQFKSFLKKVSKEVWRRFSYGGDPGYSPERVYYLNTKEVMGHHFETPTPIPMRLADDRIGMDVDIFDVTGADGFYFSNAQRSALYASEAVAKAYGFLPENERNTDTP